MLSRRRTAWPTTARCRRCRVADSWPTAHGLNPLCPSQAKCFRHASSAGQECQANCRRRRGSRRRRPGRGRRANCVLAMFWRGPAKLANCDGDQGRSATAAWPKVFVTNSRGAAMFVFMDWRVLAEIGLTSGKRRDKICMITHARQYTSPAVVGDAQRHHGGAAHFTTHWHPSWAARYSFGCHAVGRMGAPFASNT